MQVCALHHVKSNPKYKPKGRVIRKRYPHTILMTIHLPKLRMSVPHESA